MSNVHPIFDDILQSIVTVPTVRRQRFYSVRAEFRSNGDSQPIDRQVLATSAIDAVHHALGGLDDNAELVTITVKPLKESV